MNPNRAIEIGTVTVIRDDCMNILPELEDNAYDLGIVDPPYGVNAPKRSMGTTLTRTGDGYPSISTATRLRKGRLNSGGGKLKNTALQSMPIEWDYETPSPEYFKQLFRVCRNVIIWGGNYFDLPPSRCIVCWDKMQPWENFSQFEMAWTSFDKPAALFRYSNTGGVNREKKIHPTQKPVKLYEWLLKKFAKPGDTILDTHFGSGSLGIACMNMGFSLTGIEISDEYYNAACDRLTKHKIQGRLF